MSEVAEALAASTDPSGDRALPGLRRLLEHLTVPHRVLERLHELTHLMLADDGVGSEELRQRIREILVARPELRGTQVRALAACVEAGVGHDHADGAESMPADDTISTDGLGHLAVAVAVAFRDESDEDREAAFDAVMGLVLEAIGADRLSRARLRAGVPGVARELDWLLILRAPRAASVEAKSWATHSSKQPGTSGPPVMPLMSGPPLGDLPGGYTPGGVPLPGGQPALPGDDLPGRIRDLLNGLRPGRKRWDPEIWDHTPIPLFGDPIQYLDEAILRRVRCQIDLIRALSARQTPPPPRPARVVWSDGITSIQTTGPCGGDTLTIRGKGFGKPKPPDVGLMIPIGGYCTPIDVDPAAWSDTKITLKLPSDVTSGPIGFVDLAYVAQYDKWADDQNALALQIIALSKCLNQKPPDFVVVRHFSECPPKTAFNDLRAGSAIINGFTANWQALAVVEPHETIALEWRVTNAEHVRVERVSVRGPLFAGATALVDPSVTNYILGPAWHTGPERYTYRLTATGPCGTVTADVTLVASKRPQLGIGAIEVTQGIQTLAQDVKLVARKQTVVRVTVNHGLAGWGTDTVPLVTGRARLRYGPTVATSWVDPINGSATLSPTPGASITVPPVPQRAKTNDTLNFTFPRFHCVGDPWVDVEVRVTGFGATAGFTGYSESVWRSSGQLKFEDRRTLDLRYVRVMWSGSTPSVARCIATLRGALPLLPTPTGVISALAGVGVQAPAAPFTDDDRDDLLDDFDDRHNCSTWEAITEWLGSDCPDDDGAIWVLIPGVFYRGRAFDIPSNVCFTPPGDGAYLAHELSHCLDQVHLSLKCPNGQQAEGGDSPSVWPNNGMLVDVPFNVLTNSAISGNVWDVMTYCGTLQSWPLPRRWQQLWDVIGS